MKIKRHKDNVPEALAEDAYDEFLLALVNCAANTVGMAFSHHAGKTDSVERSVDSFEKNYALAKVRFEKFLLQASINQLDRPKS